MSVTVPAIIFVNNDSPQETIDILSSQLYIIEVMSGQEFDARIEADPNYPNIIHFNNLRILVTRDYFSDFNNRNIADVSILVKWGMASILKNNFGPPALSLAINKLDIHQLLRYNNSIYVANIPQTPTYPYETCGCGGIIAEQFRDPSGVHCPNPDNEYNNYDFIHRK